MIVSVFVVAIDLKNLIIARENVPLDSLISYAYPYLMDHEKISESIEKIKDYAEDKILLETEYHLQKNSGFKNTNGSRTRARIWKWRELFMRIFRFLESMVGVSREQETRKQMLHMEEFPEMSDIYKMMIKEEFCRKQISQAVREIMNTKNGAVLWHCTEGKDRCGLLSATILFFA